MSSVRIVLCMIVRNESGNIRRCLDAALSHVDAYIVCDTGSTDATLEVVRDAATRLGKPGAVFHHEWQDFGHNRTLSIREARRWVKVRDWSLERTYLLLLDADMVLQVQGAIDRESLRSTSYVIAQDDGVLRYYNTRLVCLSHEWRAVGVTHEYWEALGDASPPERLAGVWIQDVGDGGSKGEKFERDIRLLSEGLRQEPDNVRYMFYLAQSLYDTKRWAEAEEWYARRCAAGGWAEERWYARYRQGLCALHRDAHDRAAVLLLAAFEERPSRAEPLHALARHYRERGHHHLALMLARRALEIPYPVDDILFVSRPVYEWQLWEEIMISAYYAGPAHRILGLSACERLLARRGHEQGFYDYVARNEVFYLEPVDGVRRGVFAVSNALRSHAGTEYACSNPTAVRIGERIYVNVRLVNYRQERGRVYTSRDADGVIRTRNVTLEWEPRTGLELAEREASAGIPTDWQADGRVLGLEDQRWILHQDSVWFTATSCQVPGRNGMPQVVLGRMNAALDAVEHLVPLECELAREVEKNWVLWSLGRRLFLIYSCDPFVVLSVDPRNGRTRPAACHVPAFRVARFRGSTSPIRIPTSATRSILLVHEVAQHEHENVYAHRWVEIDDDMAVVAASRPFVFDHRGIEYATGLCSLNDDLLLVTYGWEDREARWIEIEWAEVRAALENG
jgi:glycosyltransferase involved in cell wall biosynthesis